MPKNLIRNTIADFLQNRAVDDNTPLAQHTSTPVLIYNEFSFQHELGHLLRTVFNQNFSGQYVVEFERNRKHFGINQVNSPSTQLIDIMPKSEIDIVVYDKEAYDECRKIAKEKDRNEALRKIEKYAIELKFVLEQQGQVPERMYSFMRDLAFCEKLRNNGFNAAFTVVLTDNPKFYDTSKNSNFSAYPHNCFCTEVNITPAAVQHGKPTGKGKGTESFAISGNYSAQWVNAPHIPNGKYYIIEL